MALAVQRPSFMLRGLSVSLGIALLTVVAGCSGADDSDLFGPEAKDGTANGGASETPATSSDSTTPSPSGGSDDSAANSNAPAPTPSKNDPGTSTNPPADPTGVCAVESLSNDDFKTADAFDGCIAGKLTSHDVDFVTTTAPSDAKQIFIKHSENGGKVAYRVFVNGFSATFTDTPPDSIPAMPNAKYTFRIENAGTSGGDRTWQLEVSFQ